MMIKWQRHISLTYSGNSYKTRYEARYRPLDIWSLLNSRLRIALFHSKETLINGIKAIYFPGFDSVSELSISDFTCQMSWRIISTKYARKLGLSDQNNF